MHLVSVLQTKKLQIVGLVVVFLLCACQDSQKSSQFYTLKGRVIDFSALKGKWVVLNYWAHWCDTCLSEISDLNLFHQKNSEKAVLLSVHYDNLSTEFLNELQQKLAIQYPLLLEDPGVRLGLQPINRIPTFILIAPNGKVAKVLSGRQSLASLESAIAGDSKQLK